MGFYVENVVLMLITLILLILLVEIGFVCSNWLRAWAGWVCCSFLSPLRGFAGVLCRVPEADASG